MGSKSEIQVREHSLKFLEMALRSDLQETVRGPDGYGKKVSVCGDSIEVFLKIRRELIERVSLRTGGCLNTNACANAMAELATGLSLGQARKLRPEDVAAYLKTLPRDHFHCAELAVGALRLALADYRHLQKNPWQKAYRR